ncbi:NAD(P)H-dependent oxidoreductase subunit E [Synechococcus sp. CS-1329]|uniref:NAD(P)H-dependent oxidoreductase subunit E n=1 Tax=Synechococcus sp. CS-1329 TaxID=2847975 RepID=UPI00223B955D|nr:NAD(P)H-dependent oxidoreductase subunit E [Synechococcus sp. CS-1329]MCT0218650.1 NAD(P)H-dependent oxidoreductase subunit E [Synechococcus sp. CS-1329]
MATASAPFAALEPLLRRHHGRADALIEVLHGAQQCYGHLSDPLLRHVAARLQLPLSRVKGTASFYHLFRFQPPARHRCVVCTGTACQIQGAPALVAAMEEGLGLKLGARRGDGWASLSEVRCLGTCSDAPLVQIDDSIGRQQTVAGLRRWLQELEP